MEIIETQWIPLPDGTKLAARLFLPDTRPCPAVLEYLPYRRRDVTAARDEGTYPAYAAAGIAGVRVDMRGTGDSEGAFDDEYSETELSDAEAVIAWIAAQPWSNGNVGMMGISWGGGMAQHFAMQHASRVRRVILIATSAGMLMMPGSPKALTKMANPRRYIDPDFMMQNFETLYGEGLGAGPGKKGHMSRLKPPSPRGYMYQLLCMLGWTSAPALPFLLKQETLIMMGDDDAIVPLANGKFLDMLIPNSELAVFEGGGHLFLLSHREESVETIREFLDRPATRAEQLAAA